jgi:hypothetical protein
MQRDEHHKKYRLAKTPDLTEDGKYHQCPDKTVQKVKEHGNKYRPILEQVGNNYGPDNRLCEHKGQNAAQLLPEGGMYVRVEVEPVPLNQKERQKQMHRHEHNKKNYLFHFLAPLIIVSILFY